MDQVRFGQLHILRPLKNAVTDRAGNLPPFFITVELVIVDKILLPLQLFLHHRLPCFVQQLGAGGNAF